MLFLYHIYYASLFVTFASCLYSYKYLEVNFKWFLPFMAFCILYETGSEFNLLQINHTDTWAANIVENLEFVLIGRFLASLSDRLDYRRLVYYIMVVILIGATVNICFVQGFWPLNSITIVTEALAIVALIFNYYYRLFEKAEEGLELIKHPPFLVVTGLLFYFLSKCFFYICYSYMVYKNNYTFFILAVTIPGLANLLLNFMLIYTFLCVKKEKKALTLLKEGNQ
jgi:hypothetical protein